VVFHQDIDHIGCHTLDRHRGKYEQDPARNNGRAGPALNTLPSLVAVAMAGRCAIAHRLAGAAAVAGTSLEILARHHMASLAGIQCMESNSVIPADG
jgi:hypothetical protein